MEFSRHNIFSRIKDSDDYFIVNLLSGNADILTAMQAGEILSNNISNPQEFIDRGYLVDPEQEKSLYRKKYLDFLDNRDTDEIQLFFVPSYACNFGCFYCYQDEYTNPSLTVTSEIIDAFFSYIDTEFASRNKYITLFGGEPLLPGKNFREHIASLLKKAGDRKIDVAIVTNGYHLADYIPILKSGSIREVQVTLDGTADIHNKRRPLKNGLGTFDKIVEGIELALQHKLPVNLRVVVDKENIKNLPALARFAIKKGWTKNPLFKTQLGRNYELHHCQLNHNKLFTRIELYNTLYTLLLDNPEILEFHKPAYSISKFLFENGELPEPLFDSCPGTKTEWAFDFTGNIYSCTATVGKEGESLGTFFPEIIKKDDLIDEWENRDVVSIKACNNCPVQLACGGGCASVAKNREGNIQAPDCRPIKELLELGIGYYFYKAP
ncbi:MAG: radical SAM protein [Bacteroidales bacterium]|nr:radical SAM protein [Bacteroidales bacterium]